MKNNYSLVAAVLMLMPFQSIAQTVDTSPEAVGQRVKTERESRLSLPLLTMERHLSPRTQPAQGIQNATPRKSIAAVPRKSPADGEVTLWGNLIYSSKWSDYSYGPFGYYSFKAESPVNFNIIAETQPNNVATNGVQIKDGHIYGLYLDSRYSSVGYTYVYLSNTDLSTGQTTTTDIGTSHLDLAATETAQATDGTVYGVFYSADGQSLEWGTVDYSTMTRTTIGPASQAFIAIGITAEGQLYGIGMDGNLYKVDKSTGTETLVGSTGINLRNEYGQYYGQSGEIDPSTDTFYWYAINNAGSGGLYTVDLNTGAVSQIDNTLAEVQGIIMPLPEANDGAPAKATDVTANFQGSSLTGTITFTAPTTTYDGSQLTGSLSYKVSSEGETLATGDVQPGATEHAPVTVKDNGSYTFTVTTSNAQGESPKETVTRWVGFDQPLPPTNVTATANGRTVSVSWTAPTGTVHGGALGSLAYDVLRVHDYDTTTVASGITETSIEDNINSSKLANYNYVVKAKAEGLTSQEAASNGVVVGDAIEPDWSTDFPDYSSFSLFSVDDVNGDNQTWKYFNAAGQHMAIGPYNNDNGNDDWLFTPPIHLQTGRLYILKFKARNYIAPYYMNTFEVKYGLEAKPSAMTTELMGSNELPGDEQAVYSYELRPQNDGTYFIGFHDNTVKAGNGRTVVDSIAIESGPLLASPDSVTNLTVIPAQQGALSAQISFTTPDHAIDGSKLSDIGYIQIKRDGKAIAYFGNASTVFVNPGETKTYTDDQVPSNGYHTYEVVPYDESGNEPGRSAKATVFIGKDVPKAPDVKLNDNVTNILATWNAFGQEGENGGYLDPRNVAVSLYELNQADGTAVTGDLVATSEPGETSVVIPFDPESTTNEDETTQAIYQLAARASSDGGQSEATATSPIVVGESIVIPFKESFSNMRLDNGFAWTEDNDQHASRWNAAMWRIDRRAAADNDGGGLMWAPYTVQDPDDPEYYDILNGDEASANTPKVTIEGAEDPVLRFKLYSIAGEQAVLSVKVQTPDGIEHPLKDFDLTQTTTTGWEQEQIDLAPYTQERYIIVKFNGISKGNYTYICIDDINILERSDVTGITSVKADGASGASSVVTIDGKLVSKDGKNIDRLPKGVYIINGHKRMIK